MKTTDYAGIDYGHGKSNISEAGIRFGVIGQNSADINHDAVSDIYGHGRNLSFEAYTDEVKTKLRAALSDYFFDNHWQNTDGTPRRS